MVISHAHDEISALGAVIVKDCNYLVCRTGHSTDQMYSGLERMLVEKGRLAIINIYK